MDIRKPWFPEDRQSKRSRFPNRGAGTLLALAAAGTLLTTWSAIAPMERPTRPSVPRVEQTAPPRPPQPVTAKPTEAPPPPEADACPEGCVSSKPGCDIKGNISKKRERIYHLPGQRYYGRTEISPEDGERWFCTEEEAVANGWRRSKV